MNTQKLGAFIAQLRKEKGLTQLQLAERLNVTDKAVSRWETGKNYPDIDMFEDLSKVLEVSVSELLEGKRIEKENLLTTSEEQTVKQIKKNKQYNKKYKALICVVVAIILLFVGYIFLEDKGVFDGVIYHRLPCYSNDMVTVLNNVDGYISQRPDSEGEFIVNFINIFIESDKTTEFSYLSGTFENGRYFYVNMSYDKSESEESSIFVGEFRENTDVAKGIPLDGLKEIIAQLDLSVFTGYEKCCLEILGGPRFIDGQIYVENDFQKSLRRYIFSDGALKELKENELHGEYQTLYLAGYNEGHGTTVAAIYYEM